MIYNSWQWIVTWGGNYTFETPLRNPQLNHNLYIVIVSLSPKGIVYEKIP